MIKFNNSKLNSSDLKKKIKKSKLLILFFYNIFNI